jgi:hypothetical protein
LGDEFGSDEHRNCDEESHLSFNIVQEELASCRMDSPQSGSARPKATM